MAGWQSGYAAACKAVDAGSIPTPASNKRPLGCPGGEIGRHKGLKIPRLNGCTGSIPVPGTISWVGWRRIYLADSLIRNPRSVCESALRIASSWLIRPS